MKDNGLQTVGTLLAGLSWVALLLTTATNDWVHMCTYGYNTCLRFGDLASKGLWVECVTQHGFYHCKPFENILRLPAYMQACRALMLLSCIVTVPALLMACSALCCTTLSQDAARTIRGRTRSAGIVMLLVGLCSLVASVWFPVSAHRENPIMSFGYSLYLAWIGSVLALLSAGLLACCTAAVDEGEARRSRIGTSSTHAKSVHV
uniref:claudin-11-like n=1 Tax=Myxine glutinosa TaxID=7769 RepID=UPI00358EAA88